MNDVDQGFRWIESFTNFEKKPPGSTRPYRLDRMRRLCEGAGHPEECFQAVHIAGSKGKGSTAAFTAALLKEQGYSVGVYGSPHIRDYRERICRGPDFFSEEIYAASFAELRRLVGEFPSEPTTFELLTLLAFLVFRRAEVDWAVIETGLGGRLDATNILRRPRICLITSLEREHTEILGETLEEIAAEKGGIIKEGIPVILPSLPPGPAAVLQRISQERQAPRLKASEDCPWYPQEPGQLSPQGMVLNLTSRRSDLPAISCRLALQGQHQVKNCLAALTAVHHLLGGRPGFAPERLGPALEKARLPGRLQILRQNPLCLLDGAHTPRSAGHTLTSLREMETRAARRILLFGMVEGKKLEETAALLAPGFDEIIVTTPGTFRASSLEAMAAAFRYRGKTPRIEADPYQAWKEALSLARPEDTLLVTGSFYLAGEILARVLPAEEQSGNQKNL